MDGIYTAFFTGRMGNSVAIFMFKDGVISGGDVGGMAYDGAYTVDEQRAVVVLNISYVVRPGTRLITGVVAETGPILVEFPLELPLDFSEGGILAIPTPTGPVNARIQKLRAL